MASSDSRSRRVEVAIDGARSPSRSQGHVEPHAADDDRRRAGRRRCAIVRRPDDERESRALHGLTRALVANMVTGVTQGYEKKLEIVGVGYRVTAGAKPRVRTRLQPCSASSKRLTGSPSPSNRRRGSRCRASTSSRSARSRRTSARCASRSRTRARASATTASTSVARSGRLGRRNGYRHLHSRRHHDKAGARDRRHLRSARRSPARPAAAARRTRSLRHMVVQLVDDASGRTLASASTWKRTCAATGDKTAKARTVGEPIAERARRRRRGRCLRPGWQQLPRPCGRGGRGCRAGGLKLRHVPKKRESWRDPSAAAAVPVASDVTAARPSRWWRGQDRLHRARRRDNRVAKSCGVVGATSFTALVVVGDGDGTVGVGYGKAKEVPAAIAKGVEEAKKQFFKVPGSRARSRTPPG